MIIKEVIIPSPDEIAEFSDIPRDTLKALEIIEPSLYGGPLKTVGRAAYLLSEMTDAECMIAHPPDLKAPVGVAVIDSRSDYIWLQSLAVDKSYRGKGIGTSLIEHIENKAMQTGIGAVQLTAIGERAIGFYEKHGYRAAPGQFEDDIVLTMQKSLSTAR